VGEDQGLLARPEGPCGGTAADNRLFVDAVIYRYRTGIPWRDLSERYGQIQPTWTAVGSLAADPDRLKPSLVTATSVTNRGLDFRGGASGWIDRGVGDREGE
jgi:hypothetical protein